MKTYVVDASVGAKWCLPSFGEEFVEEAEQLLERFKSKEIGFIVPDLFWTELTNALWKSVRRKKISLDNGLTALSLLQASEIPTIPSADFLQHALNIAAAYDRTVYDSLYVAMAVESSMEMVTADERLANSLAAYFPVKWLGAILI